MAWQRADTDAADAARSLDTVESGAWTAAGVAARRPCCEGSTRSSLAHVQRRVAHAEACLTWQSDWGSTTVVGLVRERQRAGGLHCFKFVHRTVSYALPGFTCTRCLPLVERHQCCWPGQAQCMPPAAESLACRRPPHAVRARLPGSRERASAEQDTRRCRVPQAGWACRGRHLQCLERQQGFGAAWLACSRVGASQRVEHELRHLVLPAPVRKRPLSVPLQAVAHYRCRRLLSVLLQTAAISPAEGRCRYQCRRVLPSAAAGRCLQRPKCDARRASCAACSGPAAAALPRSRAAERPL